MTIDLRKFNLAVLLELNRYRRELRHLATGSEYHPLLRYVLLTEIKMDLDLDGLDATYERWRYFVGDSKVTPPSLPPSPVLGLQLSLSGEARGGKQLKLIQDK